MELFLLVTLGSVAGVAGGIVLLFKKEWASKLALYSMPLAAGVLISISLLDLLPEAVHEIEDAAYFLVLSVFVLTFLLEKFIFPLHHHEHSHKSRVKTAVPLVIAGDTIHNFLDGVAIAAAYLTDPALGLVVASSTFLHETPHEIADFGILLKAGWERKRVFIANLLSALATFPGAYLTYRFAETVESGVGILLAVAAGLFLYVATTDLLPHLGDEEDASLSEVFFLILGVVVIVLISQIMPEHAH